MAVGTPFHTRTAPLCTSLAWKHWSGYFAACAYDDFSEPEYHAIRNGSGLIDISPLYKYDITGTDAVAFVDRLITRNARTCRVGQVLYAPWCDQHGYVIQDGTFQRLGDEWFRATAADPSIPWFELNALDLDVQMVDVSEHVAALALQGPTSREILGRLTSDRITSLAYFRVAQGDLAGIDAVVSRTGYTGDLGYEIWVDSRDAERLWDSLVAAGHGLGLQPAGLNALDLARIEAGLPLIEVDFNSSEQALTDARKSTPYDIGLGWAVHLSKPTFNGKGALAAWKARGLPSRFVGLEVSWEPIERLYEAEGLAPELPTVASRAGVPIYDEGQQVGRATSSCWSKLLKKFIALATVDAAYGEVGRTVDLEMTVEYVRRRVPARVVTLPFFDPARKRA